MVREHEELNELITVIKRGAAVVICHQYKWKLPWGKTFVVAGVVLCDGTSEAPCKNELGGEELLPRMPFGQNPSKFVEKVGREEVSMSRRSEGLGVALYRC